MRNEQLTAPPAAIHVSAPAPLMSRDEANDVSRAAGESLSAILENLQSEAVELMRRAADIQAAWAEHDWAWLADAGVISRRMEAALIAADAAF